MVQHNPIYLQLLTTINSSWHIGNHFSLSYRTCGCLVCRSDALGALQIYCCGFVVCNGVWWYASFSGRESFGSSLESLFDLLLRTHSFTDHCEWEGLLNFLARRLIRNWKPTPAFFFYCPRSAVLFYYLHLT